MTTSPEQSAATPFDDVARYLQSTIDQRHIPGAVLRIERAGSLLFETALGLRHTEPRLPMLRETLFDVASLTKVVATLGTLLTLFEEGTLNPDTRLGDLLPLRRDKQPITVRQCLAHTSGLPPFRDLHSSVMEIDTFDLDYEPGTRVVYSDLGFLLLGKAIEVVTGERLADAVQKRTAGWDMPDTGYNPSDTWRCAATEWREELGRHQVGEVHDERAATLSGVAGHAGLFSTAEDLARYGARYLPDHATGWFRRSRELQTQGLNEPRGLGWQLWQPACFAGHLATASGFGHTGFTGTSLWIDPDHDLVIVLLTNAVHFGRGSQMQAIRRQVHTLIYLALAASA